jgi:hypothetical protein
MSDKLTEEDEKSLGELASAYRLAKRAGKFFVALFVGILGIVVLSSQAWEAISKFFHAKIGG